MELWAILVFAIIGGVVAIAALFAFIARIVLFIKYHSYNKQETEKGWTAYAATRAMLDASGLQDVEVKQCGFFRALIWGNSYSVRKKTIFLRKGIINKRSMTAVGVGLQKVGLAIMDKQGDKKLKARSVLLPLSYISPILFLPTVAIGFLIDFLVGFTGIIAAIFAGVGVAIYLIAFVYMLLNIPVEKKANNIALNILEQSQLLSPKEIGKVESLFKSYIWVYVIDFIVALLELIRDILKLGYNIYKSK